MLTLKAESSFQACGNVTFFQPESSKASASAPFGSPTRSFQPELKVYLVRALGGGSSGPVAPAKEENQHSARTNSIKITLRFSLAKRFTIRLVLRFRKIQSRMLSRVSQSE